MKKLFKYFFPVAFILFLATSCEYDFVEPVKIEPGTKISFNNDLMPIFNNSCNSSACHGAGGFDPVLTPDNAYQNLFSLNQIDTANPEESVLYQSITTGSMQEYASPTDAEFILLWIEQGAENN